MIARCTNSKNNRFHLYGARGISVCERWLESFQNFQQDMGERPEGMTLDRINVNGNYEPGNCRWATPKQQGRNTRVNHLIEIKGQTKTVTEWTEIYGLKLKTVWSRISYGFTGEDIFKSEINTKPAQIFSVEQVMEIKRDYIPRVVSQQKLARKYGVSPSCIQGIIDGKNWKDLPPGPMQPREQSRFVKEAGL